MTINPLSGGKKYRWSFNTTLLQDEEFVRTLQRGIAEIIEINLAEGRDPRLVWQVVKGFIQLECKEKASHLRKAD